MPTVLIGVKHKVIRLSGGDWKTCETALRWKRAGIWKKLVSHVFEHRLMAGKGRPARYRGKKKRSFLGF